MKITTLTALLLLTALSTFSQTYEIAPWLNNKKAVVCITIDDRNQTSHTAEVEELNNRGLVATYFIVRNSSTDWTEAIARVSEGHEIANHTISHPDLTSLTTQEVIDEVTGWHDEIETNMSGYNCVSFAYPFGAGGNYSDKDQDVQAEIMKNHIGARGVWATGGTPNYDNWNVATAQGAIYMRTSCLGIGNNTTISEFSDYIQNHISGGSAAFLLYHGVGTGDYNATLDKWQQQLDTIMANEDEIWNGTYGQVVKYHYERKSAAFSAKAITDTGKVFVFTDTLSDNTIYNQALTILYTVPNGENYDMVWQGTDTLKFSIDNNIMQFNAVPDGGDIIMRKSGVTADGEAPTKPENLAATEVLSASITLGWDASTDNVGVVEYDVYLDGSLVQSVATTSATIGGLSIGIDYGFVVRARDAYGNSSPSSDSIVLQTLDVTDPYPPQNYLPEAVTDNTISVSWSAATDNVGVVEYVIYINDSEFGTTTDLEYTAESLVPGTEYAIKVTARDAAGNESFSTPTFYLTTTGTAPVSVEESSVNTLIYPNPAKDILNVESASSISAIEIINVMGQIVLREVDSFEQLDVSGLSKGLYVLRIDVEAGMKSFYVIKE